MATTDVIASGYDRAQLDRIADQEAATFAARTPRSRAMAERARLSMPHGVPMSWMVGLYRTPPIYIAGGVGPVFTDIDGNDYCDFNVCDLSMTMGYGHPAITRAVAEQAAIGPHYLLPTQAAVDVSEMLAARTGMPFWQYTLSASGANADVIRVARALTGRSKLLLFGGHYHGHLDETLVRRGKAGSEPVQRGLAPGAGENTIIIPWNDADALADALAGDDVALVLAEPALTNCLLVLPEPGFLEAVRTLTRRHGTLLAWDEAHSFQFAWGGLSRAWDLDGDFVILGKGLGTGISLGAYGMSADVATAFSSNLDHDVGTPGIGTGGTTYGSALALAAARAALDEVLTKEGYARVEALGRQLAHGLAAAFQRHGLPWTALHLGPRAGYCLFPHAPRTGAEAWASVDARLIDTRRVWMANRGLWDAVISAGPQASFAHKPADIERYLAAADTFLDELVR